MSFSIICTNKGCGQLQEPYLDKGTNEVCCSECNNVINNISPFTKRQITKSKPKSKQTFSVKCPRCGNEGQPKLVQQDIVCSGCNKSLDHLSEPFKIMLREKLRTTDKDV